jgi:hypothetical protein
MCFKNNKSAFQNHDFVDTAIAELVDNGCAFGNIVLITAKEITINKILIINSICR